MMLKSIPIVSLSIVFMIGMMTPNVFAAEPYVSGSIITSDGYWSWCLLFTYSPQYKLPTVLPDANYSPIQ